MKKKLLFLTIALSLLITCFTVISFAGDVEEVTVVNLNTEWRYLDNNTAPADGLGSLTAWTEPDFDDSSRKTGIGSFALKTARSPQ